MDNVEMDYKKKRGLREIGYFEFILPGTTISISALSMDDSIPPNEENRVWKKTVNEKMVANTSCALNKSCRKILEERGVKGFFSCYLCDLAKKGVNPEIHKAFNEKASRLGIFFHEKITSDDFYVKINSNPRPLLLGVGENVDEFLQEKKKKISTQEQIIIPASLPEKVGSKMEKAKPPLIDLSASLGDDNVDKAREEAILREENLTTKKERQVGVFSPCNSNSKKVDVSVLSDISYLESKLTQRQEKLDIGFIESTSLSTDLPVTDRNSSGSEKKTKKATPRRPLTYFAIIDGKRQDIGSGNRMRKPEAMKEFEKVAVGSKKATLFAVKVSGDQKVREINNAVSQISQVVQKERRRPEYIPEKKGGHHDRRPRHELRFGKEVEKLNKISTGNALKAAQEKSKETGEAVEVWKYVVSKKQWSMVGVAELEEKRSGTVNSVPVKQDVSQNPGAEFIKSPDAFKQQGENSQFDITHLTNPSGGQSIGVRASGPGFDVLAAISLKIKETVSANGGEKKFYILEGPIGSIVGGYLTKEEAGRAEAAVAELSRAFPGTIKLTQVELTVPEQQALVNMMLGQAH